MEKNLVITINGIKYLVVDTIISNQVTYYSTVVLNSIGKPTTTYGILKKWVDKAGEVVQVVNDDNELSDVLNEFAEKALKEISGILPDLGTILDFDDREFAIMAYIPYINDIYTILISRDEPHDIMIARIIGDIEDNTISLESVSGTEIANIIMEIYKLTYNK